MSWAGPALLALALALMLGSGWPSYAALLGVALLGAAGGLATGSFDTRTLAALTQRIVGLLENDLLQALALYALVGALLGRLAIAPALQTGLARALHRVAPRAAAPLSAYLLASLLAPMNGSVGASLAMLARGEADPRAPATRVAALAANATLGVLVPPSLVLLLLGDAMLRAHTEGLHQAGDASTVRVINTQDIMQAAALPGLLLWVGWLLVTLWQARREDPPPRPAAAPRRERWAAVVAALVIALLLALVVRGQVRAVEAAASAALLLMFWGLVTRQLRGAVWRAVIDDAMALTGALFALLAAATTVSLLLRAFGTDRLVEQGLDALRGHPLAATLAVQALLLACAFVLDAFELIFLVVPIVMPPLLAHVPDAGWVAALTLLVLQAGFLLPPFGYALVLAAAQTGTRPPAAALLRATLPYLLVLAAVLALTVAQPGLTHALRTAPETTSDAAPDAAAIDALMRSMAPPTEESAASAP